MGYRYISYVTEGVASMYINIANKNDQLKNQWKLTVDYLLRTTKSRWLLGVNLSLVFLMRSPRCLTLLNVGI